MKYNLLIMITLTLFGCKKDDDQGLTINSATYSLHYDESHKFNVREGSRDLDNTQLSWSVQDTSLGTINASGLFKAKRIGTTTIQAKKGNKTVLAQITVKPYSFLFIEPILELYKDRAYVLANEKRRSISTVNDVELTFLGDNNKVTSVTYAFEPSYGIRMMRIIFVNKPEVIEEMKTFLSERYFVKPGAPNSIIAFKDGLKHISASFSSSVGPQIEYFL